MVRSNIINKMLFRAKINKILFRAITFLPLVSIVYIAYISTRYRDIQEQLRDTVKELGKLRSENAGVTAEIRFKNWDNLDKENVNIKTEADDLRAELDKVTQKINRLKTLQTEQANKERKDHKRRPTKEHENIRRDIDFVSSDFWLYLRAELNKLKAKSKESLFQKDIDTVLNHSYEHQIKLNNDLLQLGTAVDNAESWRIQESLILGSLVQRRLNFLQNPRDCTKAKKLVCKLDKVCGFGCQLNHVTYCLIMAYGTQRTLILDSKEWHYAPEEGWESVFLPLSTNCTSTMGQRALHWNGKTDYSVIKLPFIDRLSPRPDFLPFALPLDLADRIERFHGEPAAWWIGQFVKYLTRPNAKLNKYFQERIRMLGFAKPIVGVQIRRTDKITRREAVFHDLDDYMNHVKEWFDVYERSHSNVQRRVYLATDEPTILSDAVQKYPDYKFISDNEVSKSAGMSSRYTNTSLRGILLDVHLLSMCNYLVCTFSSQVCRSAYERMQPRYGDASGCFRSLDDSYHFFGQNPRYWKAIVQHKARDADEISFEKGDFVNVAGNHWNGYSKGTHINTNKEGLFPTYKIKSELTRVSMPTYPEVEIGAGSWYLRKGIY